MLKEVGLYFFSHSHNKQLFSCSRVSVIKMECSSKVYPIGKIEIAEIELSRSKRCPFDIVEEL